MFIGGQWLPNTLLDQLLTTGMVLGCLSYLKAHGDLCVCVCVCTNVKGISEMHVTILNAKVIVCCFRERIRFLHFDVDSRCRRKAWACVSLSDFMESKGFFCFWLSKIKCFIGANVDWFDRNKYQDSEMNFVGRKQAR